MPLATLNDYKEDKETHEDQDKFYVGGQGRNGGGSGQEVLDPADMMKKARDNGAQTAAEYQQTQSDAAASSNAFHGAGVSLSGSTVDGQSTPPTPTEHTITFWKDGFSVDDGPLRTADEPENAAFLREVHMGRLPAELAGPNGDAESDVHLVDKTSEPYKPPPATVKPFQGSGRSMREPATEGAVAASASAEAAELSQRVDELTVSLLARERVRGTSKARLLTLVAELQQKVRQLGARRTLNERRSWRRTSDINLAKRREVPRQ